MPRPYGAIALMDDDDAVNVVRHEDEIIQRHVREVIWNGAPAGGNCLSEGIGDYHALENRAKQTLALVAAHGHEIHARVSVIISVQANRLPMMAGRLHLKSCRVDLCFLVSR